MTHIHAIILGIVEGITEFLPISSTAHLDIFRNFLNIDPTLFVKSFEIIIQLGAILAVIILYWKKVFSSWKIVRNIAIAFIPTGIIGFVLYKIIKSVLIGNTVLAACMLVLGGIVIVIFEKRSINNINTNTTIDNMSYKQLLLLGVAQALAVIPGVSRSGAVIIAGRSMKLSAQLITEFSFILAVPTMLLATVYDIYKSGGSFADSDWTALTIGFVVSFIVALLVVKWLINYVKTHSFKAFGWYRIIFGIIVLIALLAR